MTEVASEFGLDPKFALDLSYPDPRDGTVWDFEKLECQEKALLLLDEEDPGLLLVSPECAPFCSLQGWNHPRMTLASIEGELGRGMRHLSFAVLLCLIQYHRGRYFALEHPVGARSWSTGVMGMLLRLPRVSRATFDFCMLGMQVVDDQGRARARKRTTIATNSEAIAAALSQLQCGQAHAHIPLLAGKARACQEYPQ